MPATTSTSGSAASSPKAGGGMSKEEIIDQIQKEVKAILPRPLGTQTPVSRTSEIGTRELLAMLLLLLTEKEKGD